MKNLGNRNSIRKLANSLISNTYKTNDKTMLIIYVNHSYIVNYIIGTINTINILM